MQSNFKYLLNLPSFFVHIAFKLEIILNLVTLNL